MFTIIFDSLDIVKPSTFAAEINPPGAHAPVHPGRRKQFTTLDQAWAAGFTAGKEDGAGALPPADMDDDQTFAWYQGRESAVVGADDAGDWDAGELEARAELAELQELHERGLRIF